MTAEQATIDQTPQAEPELTLEEKTAIACAAILRDKLPYDGTVRAGSIQPVHVFDGTFKEVKQVISVNVDTGRFEAYDLDEKGGYKVDGGQLLTRSGTLCKPIYLVPIGEPNDAPTLDNP